VHIVKFISNALQDRKTDETEALTL